MPARAGADATEYGRWTILPSTMTPIVMYWPGSNGVGSPSKRTQKYARESVSSSRRTRLALYWDASGSIPGGGAVSSVMVGAALHGSAGCPGHRTRRPGPAAVSLRSGDGRRRDRSATRGVRGPSVQLRRSNDLQHRPRALPHDPEEPRMSTTAPTASD